ncbi:hypothetical protein HU200_049626 [Digitaria exilis]|uniref:Uncharacterized protein n=1 Tax=Digitaria exilis TaxID=1010633 RepID=A0A835AW11_9POAL|nr:hypothetical protein HU200_049626 [Digitaria exilis]
MARRDGERSDARALLPFPRRAISADRGAADHKLPMAGSTAMLAATLVVDLVAFGLAIGAVLSRPSVHSSSFLPSIAVRFPFPPSCFPSLTPPPPLPLFSLLKASLETDAAQDWRYCVYRPGAATALGAVALVLLLVGQAVAAFASRCFCCGAALRPGGARACALVLFLSSWYYQSTTSPPPIPISLSRSPPAPACHIDFPKADARGPHAASLVLSCSSAYHTGYRKVFFQNPPDCDAVRRGTFGAGAAFALFTCVLTSSYYYCFSKARVNFHRREATIGMTPL